MSRKFTKYPSKITASTLPIKDIKLLAKAAVDCTTKDELAGVISGLDSLGLRKLFLHYMEMLRDDSLSVAYIGGQLGDELMSYYVDDIKANTSKSRRVDAATQLPIKPEDTLYDLYQIATTWCDDSEVDQILISNGTSPDSNFIVDENTDVMQAYIDLIDYIKNNIDPDILNEREYALVYGDDIEACDKVIASAEICYRDRDNDDRVVALDAGMSTEDVEKMLAEHPSYYRSTLDRFDDIESCDKVMGASGIFYTDQGAGIGSRNQVFTEADLKSAFNSLLAEGDPIANSYDSFESWRDATLDSGLLSVEFLDEDVENPDVEFDEIDATTKPKYFANMVSASVDDGDYNDEFLVEGYYDNQRRGLAESAETSDVSSLNELIYDYANKGYYIVVHNLTDGVITEFSADNWFDDLARDGGAGLFMSW